MVVTRSSSKRVKEKKSRRGKASYGEATIINGKPFYELEVIRKARRLTNGHYEYFVQWVGYSKEYNSWEPDENLKGCQNLIRSFWAIVGAETEDVERSNGRKCYEAPPDWIEFTIENYRRKHDLPLTDKKVRKRKKYF